MQLTELQSVKQRFGIIGNADALNRAIDIAVQVAPTDLSVLITGESGVGKESFSQIVHHYSHRKHGPYIAVNCGAIPEGTIDSELFGHEKGSFTGATTDRKGYFEVANGGTIFLDEVGELPLSTQVRLLRVLETGEFIKVGSSKTQKTNVRVVAATNMNMPQSIRNGRFREDLYYRLNTVPIFVPPLRERKGDIVLLFRKFAADFADKYNMPPIRLTDGAKMMLSNYYWNGNVRQLKNITEQISVIEQTREIDEQILRNYLPKEDTERLPALFAGQHNQQNFSTEREILYQVLFDMKKDMNDLKALVHNTIGRQPVEIQEEEVHYPTAIIDLDDTLIAPRKQMEVVVENQPIEINHYAEETEPYHDEVEFQEVVEPQKPTTLQDMELQMIVKALEKNRGKRRETAKELQISERTLYRKIKEYGLDE